MSGLLPPTHDLVTRLRTRASIRRQIPGRKSVEEGRPDRIADLLEEAANHIEKLEQQAEDDTYEWKNLDERREL